jgi:RNA polymerase sigma-70 factor, ECF subfamily
LVECSELKELTDSDLVNLSRIGDQSAFSEIVRRNKTKIASTIYGMLGNCDEADDVGQEVFIRFYESIKYFRGESALSTYLIRIAINLSLNEIKKRNRKRFLNFEKVTQNGADFPDHITEEPINEKKEIIQKALQKLNSKHRMVLVLRLIDGYSTEETAKILDVPVGTVLSRLARAQIQLKKILEPFLSEL